MNTLISAKDARTNTEQVLERKRINLWDLIIARIRVACEIGKFETKIDTSVTLTQDQYDRLKLSGYTIIRGYTNEGDYQYTIAW